TSLAQAIEAHSDWSNTVSFTLNEDVTPPSAVTDLAVDSVTKTSATVTFTATGDDGAAGVATSYDLRYSTSAITNENFDSATQVSLSEVPKSPGEKETITISSLLSETTYYFALKVADNVGNISLLSNVPFGTTLSSPKIDVTPVTLDPIKVAEKGKGTQEIIIKNIGGEDLTYSLSDDDTTPVAEGSIAVAYAEKSENNLSAPEGDEIQGEYAGGEIIVKFKETVLVEGDKVNGINIMGLDDEFVQYRGSIELKEKLDDTTYLFSVPSFLEEEEAIAICQEHELVAYAEPNFVMSVNKVPNDASFSKLWGMHNSGQTGGKADADIDAIEAWDTTTGSANMIVAVIDTGVDYTHPDLQANMWTNTGEVAGNGIDDDGNGYVDDYRGWDFYNDDYDPYDDNGHGTHCSGTIGGVANNGIGVAGVSWNVKIMALKFLSGGGSGYTSDAVKAVKYATDNGAKIMSNSWGGGGYSQALKDAIDEANQKGILFIAAAGNSASNNDTNPHYPSSYTSSNVISIAATDHSDNLASFSCYGATSVDIGAPGVSIYSTVPGNSYASYNGTSMATPHVAGACALVWSHYPDLTHSQIKQKILGGGDKISSLQGKVLTNARLNVGNIIQDPDEIAPGKISDVKVDETTFSSATLSWTATGDDDTTGTASFYDIRYAETEITESNFESATQVMGVPGPKESGSLEQLKVVGLKEDTLYYFALKVYDNGGNSSFSNGTFGSTGLAKVLFGDDVENGSTNWTIAGTDGVGGDALWHVSTYLYNSSAHAWYYGVEPAYNYSTGARNYGSITSIPIDISEQNDAVFSFSYYLSTENLSPYDTGKVQISNDEGSTWTTLLSTMSSDGVWKEEKIDISGYAGQTIQVRFFFDTLDAILNNYTGFLVDDIKILVDDPGANWVAESPAAGTLAPGQEQKITIDYDASEKGEGTYTADININSNDPNTAITTIAATMQVLDITPFNLAAESLNESLKLTWESDENHADVIAGYNLYEKGESGGDRALLSAGASVKVAGKSGGNYLVDGIDNDETNYDYVACPGEMVVDLGKVYEIGKIGVNLWDYTAKCYYGYQVEVSIDGIAYNLVIDKSSSEWTGYQEDKISVQDVRYIKVRGVASLYFNYLVLKEVKAFSWNYKKFNEEIINERSYSVTGLDNGEEYSHVVTAVDAYGNESGYSEEVKGVPDDGIAPIAPSGVVLSDTGDNNLSVNWSANTETDLAGYNIYRGGVKLNSSLLTVVTLTYTDKNLTQGGSYSYEVTAVDKSGKESVKSSAVSGVAGKPNVVSGVGIESGDEALTLSWAANTEGDLAGYNIYESLGGSGEDRALLSAGASVKGERYFLRCPQP
ncbi:S8 family serine peptidase, partial [Candidatus Auribacterota bacterium]